MAEIVVLPAGSIEYSIKEAAIPIDELIEALQDARANGAERVVMSSGNHRGAQWQSISTDWDHPEDL